MHSTEPVGCLTKCRPHCSGVESMSIEPLIGTLSGALGDDVYAHNQHGPYKRRRTTPTDPNTVRQQATRRHWARTMFRWTNILTPAQREGWRVFAQNTPIADRFGAQRPVMALAMYMRCNVARQQPALGFVDNAPTVFRQPLWTYPIADTFGTTGFVFATINPADAWANQLMAALVFYVGPVVGSAINFHAAPFRRAGVIFGNPGSPPPVLNFFVDPWPNKPNVRRWAQSRVVLADGRISLMARLPFVDNV